MRHNKSKQRTRRRQWLYLVPLCIFLYHPQASRNPHEKLYEERLTHSSIKYPEQHIVSACVLIRDASSILPEFFIRNYLAGVDHFFVYGDDSIEDELRRVEGVLTGFRRIVTYLPRGRLLPEDPEDAKAYVQMRVYRHCAATFGEKTRWMAFIDADEFFETDELAKLQPRRRARGRYAFLHDVLKMHDNHPVLCVRWRSILTNGRVMPPSRDVPLSDAFPIPCAIRVNNTIKLSLRKTILKPALLDLNATPSLDVALHKGFRLKPPMHRFHCIWGPGSKITPPIYLAHYWSRSLYEYVRKIGRGRPRSGVPSRTLTDLIDRERVCVPDVTSDIDPERREVIRRYVMLLNRVEQPSLSSSTVEQLLENQESNDDSMLCDGRVLALLHHMAKGYTLSTNQYCKQMSASPACSRIIETKQEPQPFVWMEYIQQCNRELDSNKLFVKHLP